MRLPVYLLPLAASCAFLAREPVHSPRRTIEEQAEHIGEHCLPGETIDFFRPVACDYDGNGMYETFQIHTFFLPRGTYPFPLLTMYCKGDDLITEVDRDTDGTIDQTIIETEKCVKGIEI